MLWRNSTLLRCTPHSADAKQPSRDRQITSVDAFRTDAACCRDGEAGSGGAFRRDGVFSGSGGAAFGGAAANRLGGVRCADDCLGLGDHLNGGALVEVLELVEANCADDHLKVVEVLELVEVNCADDHLRLVEQGLVEAPPCGWNRA